MVCLLAISEALRTERKQLSSTSPQSQDSKGNEEAAASFLWVQTRVEEDDDTGFR